MKKNCDNCNRVYEEAGECKNCTRSPEVRLRVRDYWEARPPVTCLRCGGSFRPDSEDGPKTCSLCKSANWNKPYVKNVPKGEQVKPAIETTG